MDLTELQRHWNAFGERDPLWAILTDPARAGGRWTVDEFFATGVEEIATLMERASAHGLPSSRHRALDFGCGVGRLTQALTAHCETVLGLDVAPAMVAHARRYNRFADRVRYEVQAAPPLSGVASRSIDVVYTGRVLQHISPEYSRAYIAELARVVAPGGFLSFDVPSRWLDAPVLPPGALPRAAYAAHLQVVRRSASEHAYAFDILVTNTSAEPWPAGTPLNVGNRWLAPDGTVVVPDDQRVAVPVPLGPGGRVLIQMQVAGSDVPRATSLEFDLVHEGVTWFGWQGSPVTRVDVAREAAAASQPATTHALQPAPTAADSARFEPVMEMHAVPRAEVEAILAAAGVELLEVRSERHCGAQWEAWRYDVTAPGAG